METLTAEFLTLGGSTPGWEHLRCRRNSQDALAVSRSDSVLVLVVADGCSQGRSSEVGARLGAAWLASWLPVLALKHRAATLPDAVGARIRAFLAGILGEIHPPEVPAGPMMIREYLLFSFLAAVVTREETLILGQGDGAFGINGACHLLDPGPENTPDYLAYGLLPPSCGVLSGAGPILHASVPTEEVETLFIATDGVVDLLGEPGELPSFLADPRWITNPSLIQKRLSVLSSHRKVLRDDTTLALLRRHPSHPVIGTVS